MKKITLDEYIELTGRKELIDEIKKRIGNNPDVIDKLIVEIDEAEIVASLKDIKAKQSKSK